MPAHSKMEKNEPVAKKEQKRDPYEVLGVSRNSTDQEIKTAYRKMALKYHPDKNANDPEAAGVFQEVTFSYNILSDPEKRRQYDSAGFEAIESDNQELEVDLSSLGAVNTMFAAIFSKLGVPIKTTVSATVLEEALSGMVPIRTLQLEQPFFKKVEKQCAHFYSVTITEEEAQAGIVCRVQSPDKSKFKVHRSFHFPSFIDTAASLLTCNLLKSLSFCNLFYFEQVENDGLSLALQEDSAKTGKVTSAGMYFLGFPVYRLEQTVNSMTAAKDPDTTFFKKLDGFQPCEITEIKEGTHVFAVYGDNFFQSASYTIEVVCAAPFSEEKGQLRDVEAQILTKRVELSKFEKEYREVLAQFTAMTSRYAQEVQTIDELLRQRNEIHASYTTVSPLKRSSSSSRSRGSFKESKEEEDHQPCEKKATMRDRTKKKKWFNIPMKLDKRKPC